MAQNIEWLNENSGRAYPFHEDTSRVDISGSATIPNHMITDLVVVVPADASDIFYVRSIQVGAGQLRLVIADAATSDVAAVGPIDLLTHNANDSYAVIGVGGYTDVQGRIAFGDLSDLTQFIGEGTYEFDAAAARLEDRAVRPDLRSLRFLQVFDPAGSLSDPISGTVRLIPGSNIQLAYVPPVVVDIPDAVTGDLVPTVITPAGIRIDAVNASDFDEECACESTFPQPDPIRMINGVTGDVAGKVLFESLEGCLQISSGGANVLTIQDNCCTPCCGCPELEFITQQLIILEDSIQKLERRAEDLNTRQQTFFTNVLGSLL
jgi:hypothetical protein